MIRYRFKTKSYDIRPLKDMAEIQMPWWCTGYAADDSYATIVCYLPDDADLTDYWNDAYDIDEHPAKEIRYTTRFPKPEWIKDPAEDLNQARRWLADMELYWREKGESEDEAYWSRMASIVLEQITPVKPVENPNLIKGGWFGRESRCCGACGNNLRMFSLFCDKCGKPVDRPVSPP